MKYLESTIKFFGKFFILIVPLYILAALPSLIGGASTVSAFSNLGDFYALMEDPTQIQDPTKLFSMFSAVAAAAAGAGFLAFILRFVTVPATYGMVNKALATDRADLNDFVPSLKENFVKYVLYWVGNIVVWLIFGIAVTLVMVILGLLTAVLKWLGVLLIFLAVLAIIVAAVVIGVMLSMWYSAMVVDNLDLMAALKKSIAVAKNNFWTILGISLLVWLAGVVAGAVLGFFGLIPLIGALIVSVVPAVTEFVMIVFYMMVYRDKAREAI